MPLAPASCHVSREIDPAVFRDSVQAGDHRNIDGIGRFPDQLQILTGTDVVGSDLREVRKRLAEAVGGASHEILQCCRFVPDLFFEERKQDDRRRPAVFELTDDVEALRERRGRGHQRVLEGQAHVASGQVHEGAPVNRGFRPPVPPHGCRFRLDLDGSVRASDRRGWCRPASAGRHRPARAQAAGALPQASYRTASCSESRCTRTSSMEWRAPSNPGRIPVRWRP